ncbi:MAG TPA: hypothetical protein VGH44_03125 [Candidatus Saccharimonadia bacterium]
MLVADILNPPIQYDIIWFIIGTLVFLTILIWYGLVFWLTRHQTIQSLDSLKQLPVGGEMERLKTKYLKLIEQAYQRYLTREYKLRDLHRTLSMITRTFVLEAKHFPAPYLTLGDLVLSPYPNLTRLIKAYYPEEFALITHAEAEISVQQAKDFVNQWV